MTVYEQTSGNKYATVLSKEFSVTLKDEFAPFLRPNQYVDYANATNTVAQAQKLVTDAGASEPLAKVKVIYEYVVNNLTYDTAKAQSVQSGYLPVLDDVLAAKKGICFDYAALMTGMLRSQDVPCKLVVGTPDGLGGRRHLFRRHHLAPDGPHLRLLRQEQQQHYAVYRRREQLHHQVYLLS